MVLTTYYSPVTRLRIIGCISTPPTCPNGVNRVNFIINFAYILYVSVTSGHFVPTSVTQSRNTLLSKLGKVVLPWVNFWFFIFLCEQDYMGES